MTAHLAKQIFRLFGAVLLVAMLILVWREPVEGGWLGRLQGLVYDASLPFVQRQTDSRIVIVDIDEKSLAEVGRWPWPRAKIAQLIERLEFSRPTVIGLDILFPEPGDPGGDVLLATQLARANVVSAFTFGLGHEPLVGAAGQTFRADPMRGGDWPLAVEEVGLAASLDSTDGSHNRGHITPLYDADHIIRRLYPVICSHRCYPTLALSVLENWKKKTIQYRPASKPWASDALCVEALCLSINPDRTLSIPYQIPSAFRFISAVDLLVAEGPIPQLEGAFVLVGTSAVGLGDRVGTPLSANTSGVELHAILLAAALDGFQWSDLPGAQWVLSLAVLVLGLVMISWPDAPGRIRLGFVALWAFGLLGAFLLPRVGYWISPLPVWGLTTGAAVLISLWEARRILSQRRKVFRAFAAYVPSVVIKKLIKENITPAQLDAQRTEVTVLFADIQGFTALSERLEPEQLVEITNQLFTLITSEIHRNKGTLDKFMGDAVMAFWGAPLPQADHPSLAVDCALAVKEKVAQMTPWLAARGYPAIRMNMGLETGVVTVGNLGSRQRRAYTIMGKSVNLASHLQRQCERLGMDILLGPNLCQRLPLGKVKLLQPVQIRGIEGEQQIGCPAKIAQG